MIAVLVATRIFEKLMRHALWVLVIALIVMLLLALVRPAGDPPEDAP